MKFALVALLGAAQAVRMQRDVPAKTLEYNQFNEPIEGNFAQNNKEILENYSNVQVEGPELLGLDGWRWFEAGIPVPTTNYCTNANKATGVDQACNNPGNSAWNTHTSSVTKNPEKALAMPYPDHPGVTYKVNGETYPLA